MTMTPRTVMITGAAGNLGRAVAAAYADDGANLVLLGLRRDALERAFGAEGDARMFVPANLLDAAQLQAGVDAALAASVFHSGAIAIPDLKRSLRAAGVVVRP